MGKMTHSDPEETSRLDTGLSELNAAVSISSVSQSEHETIVIYDYP
jgi:hypothetical protein